MIWNVDSNSRPAALRPEDAYTENKISMIIAERIRSRPVGSRKRDSKKHGSVIASTLCVYSRSLADTKRQFKTVPANRPIAIHVFARPPRYIAPGSAIRSQPLMSLACADRAVTQVPIARPPSR